MAARERRHSVRHSATSTEDAGAPKRRWAIGVGLELGPEELDDSYWLSHSHAFLVDSRAGDPVGVVEDVEVDPKSGTAVALVVCAGWFGRKRLVVPVGDVEAILPGERRLIVRGSSEEAGTSFRQGG